MNALILAACVGAATLLAPAVTSAQTPEESLAKAAMVAISTVEMCARVVPEEAKTYRADHAAWRKANGTDAFENKPEFRAFIASDVLPDVAKTVKDMTPAERQKAAHVCKDQLMPALRRGSKQ